MRAHRAFAFVVVLHLSPDHPSQLSSGWWSGRPGTVVQDPFSLGLKWALGTGVPILLERAMVAGRECRGLEIHPASDDEHEWLGVVIRIAALPGEGGNGGRGRDE